MKFKKISLPLVFLLALISLGSVVAVDVDVSTNDTNNVTTSAGTDFYSFKEPLNMKNLNPGEKGIADKLSNNTFTDKDVKVDASHKIFFDLHGLKTGDNHLFIVVNGYDKSGDLINNKVVILEDVIDAVVVKNSCNVTYVPTSAGFKTIVVEYSNDVYEFTNVSTDILVNRIIFTLDVNNNSSWILVKAFPDAVAGHISFIINGKWYIVDIVNGIGKLPLNGLTAGEYRLAIYYPGDGIYHRSVTLIDYIDIGAILNAGDVVKYFMGSKNYTIFLTDVYGNPIVGEHVDIIIDSVSYHFVTDSYGCASLIINSRAGVHKITSTYNGIYGNCTIQNKIVVKKTIFGEDVELYYCNGSSYVVTVLDSEGNPVKNGTVIFNINGVFYNITAVNGVASLPIDLPPGVYTVTAKNPVNGELTSNSIKVLSTMQDNDSISKVSI